MLTIQQKAISAVATAVRNGELKKLDGSVKCVDCNSIAANYDHRDYSKPLDVEPVCRSCNRLRGSAKGWNPREDANADGSNVSLRVHIELHKKVKNLAKTEHRSMAPMARKLIYEAIGRRA